MDTLNATLVRDALTTSIVGRPIHYWATIGSTMDEARRLAEEDAPEGTVVIADEQTAGRGRLQRSWWAPPRGSVLLSLLLRPSSPSQAQRLTMICSLAVCDAIAEVAGLRARVKWPNDVLIDERKVCGILTEMDLLGERVRYAIVGIGINVNVSFQDVPLLMTSATSLAAESGRPVSRLDLLVALLAGIERRYLALCEGQAFHQEWAKRMATLGHPVQVAGSAERWDGLAIGVDEDGALLVRGEDGCVRRVLAGDVTLRPASR
jgi:BirA family biotin operon repressor/biotin-[acetyl-CoA-carboxylase] ligase